MKITSKNFWFFVVLMLGLGVRLYNINLPLLDIKPHREIHTAEETRNLYYDGEILYPKSKLWADEPGFYLAEFPIYNSIIAALYKVNGSVNETWGRVVSVLSSVGVAVIFYQLVKKYWGEGVALWSIGFFYVFSPQEIVLSRAFQPDQLGLLLGTSALYYFSVWIDTEKPRHWILSYLLLSLTLLTKAQFYLFAFPMIYLAYKKYKMRVFSQLPLYIFATAVIPFLLWWWHIKIVYETFPQLHSGVLLNPANWLHFELLINPRWYINIGYDFVEQITTLPVFLLAFLGLFIVKKKNTGLLYAWFGGLIIYALTFIGKIHFWYYQVPFLFPTVIFAGITAHLIHAKLAKEFANGKSLFIFLVLVAAILTARPYLLRTYQIASRHEAVIETGQFVQRIAPPNAKIITSSYNSAALTYYALRPDMWGATHDINQENCADSCTIEQFEKLIDWGAELYAVSDKSEFITNPVFLRYVNENYPTVLETEDAVVYDLTI